MHVESVLKVILIIYMHSVLRKMQMQLSEDDLFYLL